MQRFRQWSTTGASRLVGTTVEFSGVRKDGSEFPLEISLSTWSTAHGNYVTGMIRDLTAQKQLQETTRQQELQLIQANKMTALGTLVSGVAHEINNPNQVVLMNSRVLANAWDDAVGILDALCAGTAAPVHSAAYLTAEMRDTIPTLVREVHDSARRIERIIEDLKDFARPRAQGAPTALQLNDAVQRALRLLAHLIKKRTDHLHVDLASGLPSVRGDAQHVEQIVVNLVTNALEALPDRRCGVTVATAFDAAERRVVLEVRDEGVGIPPEHLGAPVRSVLHHQARKWWDRPRSGHYLLSRPLARGPTHFCIRTGQRHARPGHVSVRLSEEVDPPKPYGLRARRSRSHDPRFRLAGPVGGRRTQVLHSASIVLRTSGMAHVITVDDSRAVMPLLAEQEVGVLVLDLTMPHLSGQALLEQVAEDYPDIPVILMTATNDLETAVQCMQDWRRRLSGEAGGREPAGLVGQARAGDPHVACGGAVPQRPSADGYAASARSLRRNHHAEPGNAGDLSLYRGHCAVPAAGLDYRGNWHGQGTRGSGAASALGPPGRARGRQRGGPGRYDVLRYLVRPYQRRVYRRRTASGTA